MLLPLNQPVRALYDRHFKSEKVVPWLRPQVRSGCIVLGHKMVPPHTRVPDRMLALLPPAWLLWSSSLRNLGAVAEHFVLQRQCRHRTRYRSDL